MRNCLVEIFSEAQEGDVDSSSGLFDGEGVSEESSDVKDLDPSLHDVPENVIDARIIKGLKIRLIWLYLWNVIGIW